MRVIRPLIIAFAAYSRIPMPRVEWSDENRRYAMCFFPLVGVFAGAALWGWLLLCDMLRLGALAKGAVAAVLPLLITGGIHMDGFMDTCDALASWQTKERRLEILKDSYVGAFAVIGCCAYLLVTAGLLSEAGTQDAPALAVCFILSRALSAWTMAMFKNARPGGMLGGFASAANTRAVCLTSALYAALCGAVWALCGGWLAAVCLAVAALCVLAYRAMAYAFFGGVTGDLAGWFVQVAELCLTATVIIGGRLL